MSQVAESAPPEKKAVKPPLVIGQMSITYILRDFAEWTSLPGLIQLLNALNTYILALWAIIWFTMWGVFIYEVYLILKKFLQYPAEVTLSLSFKDRVSLPLLFIDFLIKDFPMVTICNQNPLRYGVVQKNSTYAKINTLQTLFINLLASGFGDVANDTIGVNAVILAMAELSDESKRAAGTTLDNFIVTRYYNNDPVYSNTFTEYLDPTYGLCYQFNFNASSNATLFHTYRAGSFFGLRAMAMVGYLPTTKSVGLRIGINTQNENPAMENYGLNVNVGQESMISMQMTEIKRTKKPYGDCVDSGTPNYYTGLSYTLTYCFRSCLQDRMIAACGCADPVYAKPDNASWCVLNDLVCVFKQRVSQAESNSTFSVAADCGCKPACNDKTVDKIISAAKTPTKHYAPLIDTSIRYNCRVNSTLFANESACSSWYSQNAAVINVWFDGLDYMQQEEDSSYGLSSASNDLGGQAGLWVGISIVSVAEVIVFLIFVFLYCVCGRKATNVTLSDDMRDADNRYTVLRQFKEELDTQDIMDEELRTRHKIILLREEIKRQRKIAQGMRLNELAVARARQGAKRPYYN